MKKIALALLALEFVSCSAPVPATVLPASATPAFVYQPNPYSGSEGPWTAEDRRN